MKAGISPRGGGNITCAAVWEGIIEDDGEVLVRYDDTVNKSDIVLGKKLIDGLTKPVGRAEFEGDANRRVGALLCVVYIMQKGFQ